jgi:ribonuclease HI
VEHLFLLCPFARSIWDAVKEVFPLQLKREKLVHAKQWVFDFLKRESSTNATVMAVTCWHIWQARNDARNNEVVLHPSRVASKVLAYVEMIVSYLFKETKLRDAQVLAMPHWRPPPTGVICVNVDAALFPTEQRMGWGAILRDHNGRFILCVREGLPGLPIPELAEAIAALCALMVTKDHGVARVELVSDCKSLIQRINSSTKDRSVVRTVVADIKLLARDFESCSFIFSSCKTNVVAHKLARCAESSICSISVGVVPELIREELCNDVF